MISAWVKVSLTFSAVPESRSVPRYIDQGMTSEGFPALVLELVDGITLKQGMKTLPHPPPHRSIGFMVDLCGALDGLHERLDESFELKR